MVQYLAVDLDAALSALADSTRRGVLEELGRAEASLTQLAETFDMSLTGMKKHVVVLERAGLVATRKVGRVRRCRLGAARLDEVTAWIDSYHQLWDARFSRLDTIVEQLKQQENSDGRTSDE
ncbi:MAG: metalloregulator ArsR/SmtB family transcription factor [Ilumatobacteraceae bacterium]